MVVIAYLATLPVTFQWRARRRVVKPGERLAYVLRIYVNCVKPTKPRSA